jgi:hypothetical protein
MRLIPSPFIALQRVYQRSPDGTLIGTSWSGTINGTIVSFKGSPKKDGSFWQVGGYPPDDIVTDSSQLGVIIRKQEAIRKLFAVDGLNLEWQSEDGSAPMKCYPIITGINFEEGDWYFQCKFSITFECQILYINGTATGEDNLTNYISDATENWQTETDDGTPEDITNQKTYRVTHNVSATGKRIYDGSPIEEAWQRAKEWVVPKLGYNATYVTGGVTGASGTPYNYVRNETIGKYDGQYSVTETWLLTQGTALEEINIETKTSIDSGLTTVSINGTVTGVATVDANMNVVSKKYDNALTKFNTINSQMISRAQTYSGITLNTMPLTTSIAKNPINGIISYSFEYDNRPTNLISGSISEVYSITDNLNTDVIAIVPVLGRKIGPVLQNIGTSKEKSRTFNIEIVMGGVPQVGILDMLMSDPILFGSSATIIQSIVDAVNPATAFGAGQSYLVENSHNWEPRSKRASLTKVWIYEI